MNLDEILQEVTDLLVSAIHINELNYPNTHCLGIGKSKGSQWVLSDATL